MIESTSQSFWLLKRILRLKSQFLVHGAEPEPGSWLSSRWNLLRSRAPRHPPVYLPDAVDSDVNPEARTRIGWRSFRFCSTCKLVDGVESADFETEIAFDPVKNVIVFCRFSDLLASYHCSPMHLCHIQMGITFAWIEGPLEPKTACRSPSSCASGYWLALSRVITLPLFTILTIKLLILIFDIIVFVLVFTSRWPSQFFPFNIRVNFLSSIFLAFYCHLVSVSLWANQVGYTGRTGRFFVRAIFTDGLRQIKSWAAFQPEGQLSYGSSAVQSSRRHYVTIKS